MHEETSRSRFVVLVEPPLALLLAFVVSILFGIVGFFATALLVENDPIGALLGMERKLDIRLTPRDAEASPALDDHLPSVFLSGAVNYALDQLEQAEGLLNRYVAAVPDNIRARKLLGATLVRNKNFATKANLYIL